MVNRLISECTSEKLDKLAENVVQLLKLGKYTLSTAESCTGGLLSELITSVPGASAVFETGGITMKNSKANGSPVSQNGRNVNTFSEKIFKGSLRCQ